MNKKWMVMVAIVSLATAADLRGQEASLAFDPPAVSSTLPVPGEKSPFLAGVLSGMVFPGLGSFYAGNGGHGVRHLAIAGASAIGMFAAGDGCFEILSSSDSDCTVAGISAGIFVANWIWSIVAGVGDTNAYNRTLETAGLRITPQLVAVHAGGDTRLGLELVSFGF